MSTEQTRYRIPLRGPTGITRGWLADSARWDGFEFRPGDIVISSPAKSGTTWLQMICALLVFQTTELPAPLTALSPWLDMCVRPIAEVRDELAGQHHRRFIKTHTPLDGVPADDRVSYLAVGRDPRDAATSLHHHRANISLDRLGRLLDGSQREPGTRPPAGTIDERGTFLEWLDSDASPIEYPYSLRGMVWHHTRAWRRRHDPNTTLVHYGDLSRDLEGEMRRLADRLAITVPDHRWPELVTAATFTRMRERSEHLVPDERLGLIVEPAQFFRAGTSGGWRRFLTDEDLARYERRLSTLAPPEIAHWLHHGRAGG